MKELIKNAQITQLYYRKYWKHGQKREYALLQINNDKWIWANDYLKKHWKFSKGEHYDLYVYDLLKGKNKKKSFLYDYCLAAEPRELSKQFRSQWIN